MDTLREIMNVSFGGVTVEKICGAVVIFVLGYLLIRLLIKLMARMLQRTSLDEGIRKLVLSVLKVVCYFILAITIAGSLDIPVTSLVAAFSVVGLAFSLAIQGALSNLAGGIMILVSKPFFIGDYIAFHTTEGSVQKIGLIYTKLLTADNKSVSIPNSEISNAQVVNYTAQKERRLDLNFSVSYDAPLKDVKEVLYKVLEANPDIEKEPAPFVGIMEYQSSSIQYVIRAWVRTEAYWNCRFALMEEVKNAFDENKIEMTYEHLNVHIKG